MIQVVYLLIFTLFYAFLAWKRRDLAIVFLIFVLPSYLFRFGFFGIPMTVLELMILVLFGVWILRQAIDPQPLSKNHFKYPILFFLLVSVVAIFVSDDLRSALGSWKAYFLEPILFFIVFINTIRQKKDWQKIFYAFGLSAIVLGVIAIVQKITGIGLYFETGNEIGRVTTVFGYPNANGLFLTPIIILYFGWLFDSIFFVIPSGTAVKSRDLLFKIAVLILSCLTIYFSQSEGAWIASAVGITIFLLVKKQARKFMLAILLLGAILFFSLPQTNFFQSKILLQDFSGQIRLAMWSDTWQMLKNNPIAGAGLANYQNKMLKYHREIISLNDNIDHQVEIYLYPHNIFLTWWSELGILGLIALIWLAIRYFWLLVKNAKNKNSDLAVILISVLAGVLIYGLVDVPYFKNDLSVMWWLWFGLGNIIMEGCQSG